MQMWFIVRNLLFSNLDTDLVHSPNKKFGKEASTQQLLLAFYLRILFDLVD